MITSPMILFVVGMSLAYQLVLILADFTEGRHEVAEAEPRSEWQRLPWEAEPGEWRWLQIDKQDTRQQETAK